MPFLHVMHKTRLKLWTAFKWTAPLRIEFSTTSPSFCSFCTSEITTNSYVPYLSLSLVCVFLYDGNVCYELVNDLCAQTA